ncbi:hypothetical protein ACQCVM_11975 [Rossellomorea aquimaris]|uniref:hypothetical protein n=1 Tax=Rossellomorea aquimaris TaxID=189382 RepID=UPI003CED8BF1
MNYFQEDEQVLLQKSVPNLSNHDETTQQYISLIRRMESCIKHNVKADSEEGFQIGTRLLELSNDMFQGDKELMDKFWKVRKQPVEDTGLYPISDDYWSLRNVVWSM